MTELERISGYSIEETKNLLLANVEKDIKHEASVMIKDVEYKAKEEADKKAREIITGAIQRCAADHVAESTVSVVNLPNNEMKGRIIGHKTFEASYFMLPVLCLYLFNCFWRLFTSPSISPPFCCPWIYNPRATVGRRNHTSSFFILFSYILFFYS